MTDYNTRSESSTVTERPVSAVSTTQQPAEDVEVIEDAPRWDGPHTEYDKYGQPTGAQYVRCTGCGIEVLEGDTRHATHRDGCSFDDA